MSRIDLIKEKIVPQDGIESLIHRIRVKGKKVVFTNGVFDILHRGHVTLLNKASELGDFLIVGLNSDASVRTLGKGPERPINGEGDRAIVLASLQCVGAVICFEESTPYELIRLIMPDVLVKGGDYNPKQSDPNKADYIVGSDLMNDEGKNVVSINLVEGYSTTGIIEKSKNG